MTEVLSGAKSDSSTAPRASSNIRHLCRMEIAGEGRSSSTGIMPISAINTGHREQRSSTFPIRASRRFSAP